MNDDWYFDGTAAAKAGYEPQEQESYCILTRASDLKAQRIRWLWEGWLAAGKLHVLAGPPGVGKSTLALALAAVVSGGGRWPDLSPCRESGHVVIWSGEDDAADTLVPRLTAAGADPSRVHFVSAVAQGGQRRFFDPAFDMWRLSETCRAIGAVRLLILDPLVSAVSGDGHKNIEVRRGLQAVVDFAAGIGAAVLGITHFSKGSGGRDPLERVSGSLAFGALARLVLGVPKVQGEDGRERRAFVRVKSNIGPDEGGYYYDLEHREIEPGLFATAIVWQESIDGQARDILKEPEAEQDGSEREEAMAFLQELLADGPVAAKEALSAAKAAGFAERTVNRAKKALAVKARKSGSGGWSWELPTKVADAPQAQNLGHLGNVGNLNPQGCQDGQDCRQKEVAPFGSLAQPGPDDLAVF